MIFEFDQIDFSPHPFSDDKRLRVTAFIVHPLLEGSHQLPGPSLSLAHSQSTQPFSEASKLLKLGSKIA